VSLHKYAQKKLPLSNSSKHVSIDFNKVVYIQYVHRLLYSDISKFQEEHMMMIFLKEMEEDLTLNIVFANKGV
jgi:hypothetical protein